MISYPQPSFTKVFVISASFKMHSKVEEVIDESLNGEMLLPLKIESKHEVKRSSTFTF